MEILAPFEVFEKYPLSPQSIAFVENSRDTIGKILKSKLDKVAVILGPCSIHNPSEALVFAKKIAEIAAKTPHLFLVMRVFLAKPRSIKGWTGLVYDPRLDETFDMNLGIVEAYTLLKQIAELNVPSCMEFLDPFLTPYFKDLISWAMIGARTSSSQTHRQIASMLPCPVGFKNTVMGDIEAAIYGILASQTKHSFLTLNHQGKISSVKSNGNPGSHLVLRGSQNTTNFDTFSVNFAAAKLREHKINPAIIIDCAHGNSQKNYANQPQVFKDVFEQIVQGQSPIKGLMLESNLKEGNQPLSSNLNYGVSITDSCLGWEETEKLLLWANEKIDHSLNAKH